MSNPVVAYNAPDPFPIAPGWPGAINPAKSETEIRETIRIMLADEDLRLLVRTLAARVEDMARRIEALEARPRRSEPKRATR